MKNYEHSFMNAFVCLFLMEERLWFMQVFYSVQDLKWDQKTSTAQVKLFRPNSHFDTLNLKRAREALWGSMEICEFVIFGIFTDSLRFAKKGEPSEIKFREIFLASAKHKLNKQIIYKINAQVFHMDLFKTSTHDLYTCSLPLASALVITVEKLQNWK